ncbi:MAG: AMP-binding protein, partial [Gemmatimonadetes bacterium]|nr:AMP-binding protein [Gemmatimonadota bacterium]
MNITQILFDQATQRPEAPAIVEAAGAGSRTLTFVELAERSARAAALLQAAGLRKGDRVLVFQPMSIELYVALLAIFRLGLVATVLDPSAGRGHIEQCCGIARPRAFIGPARAHILRFLCRGLRRIERHFVTAGWAPRATRWSILERYEPLNSITPCDSLHDALLTFTSGSTGVPKAAVRSHGFLLAQHEALAESIELEPGEVDLPTLPIFVLANLASGVTTVIPQGDLRRPGFIEPGPVLEQIERHRVTRTVGSPALYARLLRGARAAARGKSAPEARSECDDTGLRTLRKLYTGGAPVFPPLLQELQSALPLGRVIVVYGSTEAEPISHLDWADADPADRSAMFAGKGLLVGRPVRQIDLRILRNQWGEPLPAMNAPEFDALALPPEHGGEIVV